MAQCRRLGQCVGDQSPIRRHALAIGQRQDEIHWRQCCALMQQLVIGVLAISAGRAPDDGRGGVVDQGTIAINRLAVGFHFQLLQPQWQRAQIMRVGNDGMAVGMTEVDIPDVDHGQ